MISKEELDQLAQLARLTLAEGEISALESDISRILEYVGQVSAAPASPEKKEAPAHRTVMRPDVPYAADAPLAGKREALLEALPRRQDDFAVVRKIIQKDA